MYVHLGYYLQPLVHITRYTISYLLTNGSNLSRRAKGVGVGRETAGFDSIRAVAVGPHRSRHEDAETSGSHSKLNLVKVGCTAK